ncbi:hypothetical protein MASR2M78_28720 [Treponema sp.]
MIGSQDTTPSISKSFKSSTKKPPNRLSCRDLGDSRALGEVSNSVKWGRNDETKVTDE